MDVNREIEASEKEMGSVKISPDVVAVIAAIAASEIEGVCSMSSSIAGGISEFLGKKNYSKGVKVDITADGSAVIDLYIIAQYGANINSMGEEMQAAVKKSVENMTGLNVIKVNVHVQGINLEEEPKEKEKE